jgi:hypothetical protein
MNSLGSTRKAELQHVRGTFLAGEKVYAAQGSPLYAALAVAGAEDEAILEIASHGLGAAVPVHLFTSVHYLLLGGVRDPLARYFPTLADEPAPPGEAWPHFRRFCLEHREELIGLLRSRPVQMTYVDRCRALLPPLCVVAEEAGEPLNLIEIGCSAGVLLTFDRYAYEFREGERIGPADAPFLLKGELAGGPRLRMPRIGSRTGIDLNLIDPHSEQDRRWMLATCFPELLIQQAELAQAMDIVAGTDIRWMEGDALVHLPTALADTPDPVCVYHSACLFYWPPDAKAALDQLLREASNRRTIYRIGVEPTEQLDSMMSGHGSSEPADKQSAMGGETILTRYADGRSERRVLARRIGYAAAEWLDSRSDSVSV